MDKSVNLGGKPSVVINKIMEDRDITPTQAIMVYLDEWCEMMPFGPKKDTDEEMVYVSNYYQTGNLFGEWRMSSLKPSSIGLNQLDDEPLTFKVSKNDGEKLVEFLNRWGLIKN